MINMMYTEIVVKAHHQFYPDGGDDLENTRFFAHLALIFANFIGTGRSATEQDIFEMCKRAEGMEKRLKHEYGG